MNAKRTLLFGASCALVVGHAAAFQGAELRSRIEAYVESHQQAIVGELVELLSIPNHHADQENILRNAEFLRSLLAKRGFAAELLATRGNPLVYGELLVPGATRTVLVYIHYDGQAVDPDRWGQADPFGPILRDGRLEDGADELPGLASRTRFEPDWRIYARSASDDKGPIIAFLTANDALRAAGIPIASNLRVILDGEEEGGFGSLVPAIATYREKLRADLMLIFDGATHPSGRPTVVFGARGSMGVELTAYGPKFPLHSGHYGNWAPNPAMRLTHLLASMKDDEGRVLIEGFYDDIAPPPPEEQAMLDAVPDDHEGLLKFFGLAAPENADWTLQEALQVPTLNIRGLSSGFVGEQARTIIPDRAVVLLDVRLVKETPVESMRAKVRAHIQAQGFHIVEEEPSDDIRARHERVVRFRGGRGTNAFRTSPLLPESKRVVAAITDVYGEAPITIRTMGGSLPITPFIEALGFPAIVVPTVNFDNNQHSPNENLRMGHFFSSIVTMAAVLTR